MTGSSGRAPGRWQRDRALGGLLLLGAVVAVWFGFDLGGRPVQAVGCWVILIGLHATEVTLALSVAALPGIPASARRFWQLIGGGAAMFGVAGVAQLVVAVRDPYSPVVASGTLTYMIALAFGAVMYIAAMLTSPLGLSGARERFRFWLDAATVLVGVAIFAWHFTAQAGGADPNQFHTVVKILFGPAAFLVVAFGLVKLTLGRNAPFTPAAGAWGCASAAIESLAIGLSGPLIAADRMAWQLALGILANVVLTAAIRVQHVQVRAALLQPRRARAYSRLPYVAVAATYGLLVWVLADSRLTAHGWAVLGAAIVSTGLVVVRQLAAFADNADLVARLQRAVDERDTLAAELRHLAYHDSLTGLGNRALFLERLDGALARQRRGGGPVSLLIVDLDDFKPVNDRHGHQAGDTLLREVAGRMVGCVREVDTVARLGGDEFAVLVEQATADEVEALVVRLAAAVERPVRVGDAEVAVRASIGVASSVGGAADLERLLTDADLAMYAMKERGKSVHR